MRKPAAEGGGRTGGRSEFQHRRAEQGAHVVSGSQELRENSNAVVKAVEILGNH